MPLGSGGTEKRYINGREIEIKPKQPVEIQKTINRKSFDLPGDLKDLRSTFDPQKLYKEYGNDLADAFGRDTFTSFSKMRDSDREKDKQRFYQVYRDMYTQVFIKNALDVIKNEVAQKNDENNLIKITSDNQDIIDDGENLFFDILDINHELKTVILETCQMGENYYEIVLDNYKNPKSIIHLEYLSPERMSVFQINGRIKYYAYTDEDMEFSKGKNNVDPWNFMDPHNDGTKKIRVFMPWQIVHFKIKDRQTFPYGRSLLRAGVKDYRRLALLEDAMLVYRLCLKGDSRIWTPDGYKYIENIKPNDIVYSINKKTLELEKTKVVNQWCTGIKPVYKVSSKHRDIIGTDNHPILVKDSQNNISYVSIKDIIIGEHEFIIPELETKEEIKIPKNHINSWAFLNKEGKSFFKESNYKNISKKINNINSSFSKIKSFLYNKKQRALPKLLAEEICNVFDIPEKYLIYCSKNTSNGELLNLPDYVDENFARFFGFMIGDGSIDSKKNTKLMLSLGNKENINNQYINLTSKYYSNYHIDYKYERKNTATFCSKTFIEILLLMGYIPGAHNKRIPSWVFESKKEIQEAFIEGLMDADGHRRQIKNTPSMEICLCNKKLIEDLKELCHRLNWNVGEIRSRIRKGNGRKIKDTETKSHFICDTECYELYLTKTNTGKSEKIYNVEYYGEEKIYDIEVDSEEHNFIANGIPVKNSRAPERRVFYVDVGQLNSVDAKIFLNKIKNMFKKEPIIDEDGQLSGRANVMCIALDTKIPLLDGRELTLQELIKEHSEKKTNWVYSIDRENKNKLVPGKIIDAACTRKNAEVVEVILDNEEKIICTPDHKFLMRDGSYKEAQHLKKDDSVMPLYRKKSDKKDGMKVTDYEMTYDPKKEKYLFTHRIVGNTVLKEERELTRKKTNWGNNNNLTIHHVNFSKQNDSPENLKWIGNVDHILKHSEIKPFEHLRKYIESDRHKENTRRTNIERNSVKAMAWYNGSELHKEHNAIRSENMKKQFSNPELRKKYIAGMTICDKFTDKFWNTINEIAKKTKPNRQNYISIKNVIENIIDNKEAMLEWNDNISIKKTQKNTFNKKILERALKHKEINSNQEWLNNLELPTKDNRKVYKNHKIISVNFLNEKMDTGCITIDKFHNFAVSSGIFIKNSLMEDFYIPVREGSSATRIETLPPGQQLNEIKDLDYFKNKLLRLLNIPMPYMGGDAEGSGAEMNRALSNIDIKFANYVEEIQTYVEKGLNKILALQLILKKYKNEDIINFKIKLTPPSNLAELIKLDFMTQQAAVAGTYKGLQMFSDEWIYKKVFKLSNKEIYQEQIKIAAQMQKLQQTQQQQFAAMGGGVMPGMEGGAMPGMEGGMGAGAMGAPPPAGGMGVQPPPPARQEIASFDPNIYELGLKYLQENYEEIIVNDLAKKFGEGYLIEEKEDVIKMVAELQKLRKVLEKDEIKDSIKKRMFKNNFKSMVRLGEFNGWDVKNNTLKFYRNDNENIIDLKEPENDDNKQLIG